MVTKASLGVVDPEALDRANHTGEQSIETVTGLSAALAASDISAGTWTPTLTNVSNLVASGALECTYQRIGNIVNCWGAFTAQASTGSAVLATLRMSLPVASDFTTTLQARGSIVSSAAQRAGVIASDITNNAATISWTTETATNLTWTFSFSYEVV